MSGFDIRWGVPWFTEMEEMLDSVELDVCYIATPPHTHLEQVQTCAERGLHVLCEKPLDITVEGAEAEYCRLAALATAADRQDSSIRKWLRHLAIGTQGSRIVDSVGHL